MERWRNWARNQTAAPARTVRVHDANQIAEVVATTAAAGKRIKAVGTGHSFSPIARPCDVCLVLDPQVALLAVDESALQVTAPAGMSLRRLNRELWNLGWALPNLSDIDAQTLGGAISTATPGTGARHRGLASQVRAFDLVCADGNILRCSPTSQPRIFDLARVGLGALGVLASVTLQCVDAFWLHAVQTTMPLGTVSARMHELCEANEYFEFYWFTGSDVAVVKANNRANVRRRPSRRRVQGWLEDEVVGNLAFGALCNLGRSLPGLVPHLNRISSRSLAADYVDTAPQVLTTPRRVRFLELEYAVPRSQAPAVLAELVHIADKHAADVMFPIEVRFAAADDVPLSPAVGRDTAYFAVHVHRRQSKASYFAAAESLFREYAGRPHWGKLHSAAAGQLMHLYPRFPEFVRLREEIDPRQVFANPCLDRLLGPSDSGRP
jgi:FAD-linked oxidoreductase